MKKVTAKKDITIRKENGALFKMILYEGNTFDMIFLKKNSNPALSKMTILKNGVPLQVNPLDFDIPGDTDNELNKTTMLHDDLVLFKRLSKFHATPKFPFIDLNIMIETREKQLS